jgi:intracellular multiplication protein IcmB
MISMIIDESYVRLSDNAQPKLFVRHSDDEIEAAIAKFNIPIEHGLTWWQLTDLFFQTGEHRLALKAQRYAMPTIADTVAVAYQNSIKDLFADIKTPAGENYVDAYSRNISGVIRSFPTLTSITRLDFEGTKVVSLDLDEVAKSGSAAAEKQTAIMYMLARHVLGRDFFLNANEVEKMLPAYQPYHLKRTKEIMEEPKRIVFDEFHRTSKSPAIREQVLQDMREGRKWKIHIALSSQSLKDFDELMIEFATSVFVLDSGTSMSVEATCKTFGLTETERLALATRVHGPSSEGATFIAQFVTKKGMNTQLLTSTISPVELWAFNTTVEDVNIRDRLYQAIGPAATRRLLADRFPKGSAMDEIEMILKNDAGATVNSICDIFINEIITSHRRIMRNKKAQLSDSGLL